MEIKYVSGESLSRRDHDALSGLDDVLARIDVLTTFGTGFSGAVVIAAYVEPVEVGGPHGKYIIKIDSKRNSKDELRRTEAAARTSIGNHMARLIHAGRSMNGRMALVYEVALHELDDAISLRQLLDDDIHEACIQIGDVRRRMTRLQSTLSTWYAEVAESVSDHPFDIARFMLGRLLEGGGSVEERVQYLELDREVDEIRFLGRRQEILPNPVAYAYRRELWGKTRGVTWITGHAHGDLHQENIVCLPHRGDGENRVKVPVLIDFATFDPNFGDPSIDSRQRGGGPLYDLAYLEIALMRQLLTRRVQPQDRSNEWVRVVREATAVLDVNRIGEYFQVLRRLRRIVTALAQELRREDDRDIENSYWIALWAAGLNFARKRGMRTSDRLLAIMYAGYALKRVLENLGVPPIADREPHTKALRLDLPDPEEEIESGALLDQIESNLPPGMADSAVDSGIAAPGAASPGEAAPLPSYDSLRADPFRGVEELITFVEGSPDRDRADLDKLEKLAAQLHENRRERSGTSGSTEIQIIDEEYHYLLRSLTLLARKYLPEDFTFKDLCEGRVPEPEEPDGEEDAEENRGALDRDTIQAQIRALFQRRERIKTQLNLERQFMSGHMPPSRQDDLEDIERELRALQQLCPPAWLEIRTRVITERQNGLIYQDQPLRIEFTATNMGAEPTEIHLDQGRMAFLGDIHPARPDRNGHALDLELAAPLDPGQVLDFGLGTPDTPVAFLTPQRLEIAPAITHTYSEAGWDKVVPAMVEIRAGSQPELEARRYYRPQRDRLVVIIRLTNRGDRAAYNVHLTEQKFASSMHSRFQEDYDAKPLFIPGLVSTEESYGEWTYDLPTRDLTDVTFPEETLIAYEDSSGQTYEVRLGDEIEFLNYDFSASWTLIGREDELERFDQALVDLANASQTGRQPVHLVTLTGESGIGKSRLIEAFEDLAVSKDYRTVKDAVRRHGYNVVRRLILLLLGQDPESRRMDEIELALRSRVADTEMRDALYDFLAASVLANATEVMIHGIAALLRDRRTLIVLENTQYLAEGTNEELLRKVLINLVTWYPDLPFMFCVAYTTTRAHARPFTHRLDLDGLTLNLGALEPRDAARLINAVITSPPLSEALRDLVIRECHGNPQNILIFLQWLTADAQLIEYTPSGWIRSEHFTQQHDLRHLPDLEERTWDSVNRILASDDDVQFLLALSVVGSELPALLIQRMYHRLFPDRTEDDCRVVIDRYIALGYLIHAEAVNVYRFKHDLIRRHLYRSPQWSEEQKRTYRQHVLDILFEDETIYPPAKHGLEIAHHISKLPLSVMRTHAQYLVDAARAERENHSYTNSIEYFKSAIDALTDDHRSAQVRLELIDLFMDVGTVGEVGEGILPRVKTELDQVKVELDRLPDGTREEQQARRQVQGRYYQQLARWYVLDGNWEQAESNIIMATNTLDPGRGPLGRISREVFGPVFVLTDRVMIPIQRQVTLEVLDLYLDLAEILVNTDQRKWSTALGIALRLIQQAQNKETLPVSTIIQAKIHAGDVYALGGPDHWAEARAIYDEAMHQADAIDDDYLATRAQMAITDLAYRQYERGGTADLQELIDSYKFIADRWQEQGDMISLARAYSSIANLHWKAEQDDDAVTFAELALRYLPVTGDRRLQLEMHHMLICHALDVNHEGRQEKAWESLRGFVGRSEVLSHLAANEELARKFLGDLLDLSDAFSMRDDTVHWQGVIEMLYRLRNACTTIRFEDAQEVEVQYARSLFMAGRVREAITLLEKQLDTAAGPDQRAHIHEVIGDIYADDDGDSGLAVKIEDWAAPEENRIGTEVPRDAAELNYERALDLLLARPWEEVRDVADRVYGKLLQRVIRDPESVANFPVVYYHLFRTRGERLSHDPDRIGFSQEDINRQIQLIDHFAEPTATQFRNQGYLTATADVYVHSGNLIVWIDSLPREQKMRYYRSAEQLYRQTGDMEELIDGLYMLMHGLYILDEQRLIGRHFLNLVEISFENQYQREFVRSTRHLVSTMNAITVELDATLNVLNSVMRALDEWDLEDDDRANLMLQKAKLMNRVMRRFEGTPAYEVTGREAIDTYYQAEALTEDKDEAYVAMILNDTALIYARLGENDRADTCYERAVELMRRLRDDSERASQLLNYAQFKIDVEQYDAAETMLAEAASLNRRVIEEAQQRRRSGSFPLRPDQIIHYMRAESRAREIESLAFVIRRLKGAAPLTGADRLRLVLPELLTREGPLEIRDLMTPEVLELAAADVVSGPPEAAAPAGFTGTVPADAGREDGEPEPVEKVPCPHCGEAVGAGQFYCMACEGLRCPQCGAPADERDFACSACERVLPLSYCDHCGFPAAEDDVLCNHCGASLLA